jgi:alpha-D-ribose 1-methylphosphonate 5-phosphate C-P lyase
LLLSELQHMPLGEAYLCEDCKQIGNRANACAHCGSEHGLMSLANVLDRQEQKMIITVDSDFAIRSIDPFALDLTERN